MEKMETDIIVVAAGLSGLAAAISAAENGAGVLVFEKSGTTGGAANMGMGPLGVGSVSYTHLPKKPSRANPLSRVLSN